MDTYVYVCGYYLSEYQRSGHTLYVCLEEKDALNKMVDKCANDVDYEWLFEKNINFMENLKNITTYQEFNEFIKNYCKYYNNYEENAYLYIEKIKLN